MAEHEIKAGNTTYKVTGASNRTEAGAAVFDHMVGNIGASGAAGTLAAQKAEARRIAAENIDRNTAQEEVNELLLKGLELYNNGNYNGAAQAFDNALSIEDSEWKCNCNILLGRAFNAMGNYDKALNAFNSALSSSGEFLSNSDFLYADCFYERAIAYSNMKDYDNAIADCTKALYLGIEKTSDTVDYPDDDYLNVKNWYYKNLAPVYFFRANCYIKKGDWKEAVADLRQASELGSEDAKKALKDNTAKIAEQDKADKTQYESDIKSANEGNAEACYRVGYCYERGIGVSKNLTEAEKWYLTAAEKEQIAAVRQLGFLIYKAKGGYEKGAKAAYKWLKIAIKNNDELSVLWSKFDFYGSKEVSNESDKQGRIKKIPIFGAIILAILLLIITKSFIGFIIGAVAGIVGGIFLVKKLNNK